ncbi:hypothetical protein VTO42DRAFT_1832 [Malbranchea cinnamomea]
MPSFTGTLSFASLAACAAAGAIHRVRAGVGIYGISPNLPFDPNTTEYCTYWYDNNGGLTCEQVVMNNFITLEDFIRWNPSITADCGNFQEGYSYCVEAVGEPDDPPPPTTTTTSTTPEEPTDTPPTTTTTSTPPANGIETPEPIQPGMVDNCDAFHFVARGEGCADIASQHGITLDQFVEWNPQVGEDCTGLWAEVYVCVSVIGHEPTPTDPGNGIETPTPTQPGMVADCDAFHFVERGEGCADIASQHGITLDQFVEWNPQVGEDCTGLWAEVYVCVSVIGHEPTPTDPGNGIETPTPIQPGMVDNCDEFYFVQEGDGCQSIADKNGISLEEFYTWNPEVGGEACTGLWLGVYVCVSVIGHTPTPTDPGNGIETPTPTQPGMTPNCKSFHFVQNGEICETIIQQYGITLDQFVEWNPAVKSDCSGMWAESYVCVAVL